METLLRTEDVPKDLICPICLLLPKDPWIIKKCSHIFCEDCIKESLRFQRSCPVCRAGCSQRGLFPLREANPLAHRIWSDIVVKCDAEECHWTGPISNYESHCKKTLCSSYEISGLMEELNNAIEEEINKAIEKKDKLRAITKSF